MKAIILAGGTGSRLNFNRPKGFLNIYGKPLISYSLKALKDRNVDPIIATGFGSSWYEGLGYPTRHNKDYEKGGSLKTLSCARDVEGDVLILESDLLYDPLMLDGIINCPENAILLGTGNTKDAVFVEEEKCYLKKMSKDAGMLTNPVDGILVGITKMKGETFAKLMDAADEILKENPTQHYDYAFETLGDKFLIYESWGIFTEIDDQEQLEYAINYVYPRIVF